MSVMTFSNSCSGELALPVGRIAEFCRYLRENGLKTTTRDAELLIEVLHLAGPDVSPAFVEQLWRPIACRSLKDWKMWSEIFQLFWFPHKTKGTVKVTGSTRKSRDLRQMIENSHSMVESAAGSAPIIGDSPAVSDEQSEPQDKRKAAGGASSVDPIGRDIESQWMPSDLTMLERIARQVRQQLLNVPTRRWRGSERGRILDIKKTAQSMIRFAGDGLVPSWQVRRKEAPQIIMMIDVSRSMESYATFYLRLARAFSRWLPMRVFVFHIRYSEITEFLLRDNPNIQEKIDAVTAGFQGGTKIARCIRQICFEDNAISLNRRTRVWVFSDGYDTDQPTALRDVLSRVRGRGATVEWFYPNKTVAGMSQCIQLITPLVKNWYSAANLTELESSARGLN
ncbi:MAG: VWA domain-containing protein [Pseudomonadota bacterium]|nr:VWA domain-containing protein [Pseudomonadota bacterium]